MVGAGFGFSIGDFVAGGQVLIEVINAFKAAGGASSKYASEVSFLNSLKLALDHLEQFVGNASTSASQSNGLPKDISKLLEDIREPWKEFKKFLDKYEASLGTSSKQSRLARASRTVQYTVKDISGKVEKLRRRAEQPLQAVNSLLSLHLIQSLEKLPKQALEPAQYAQLVEAIKLADIPTELDIQIRELKRSAHEQNGKQDEQLQAITTLRTQLDDRIADVQVMLDEVKPAKSVVEAHHNEQLDASRRIHTRVDQLSEALGNTTDHLGSALLEQQQLILALKSFLEDKAFRIESALQSSEKTMKQNEDQCSWPSPTLSSVHYAAVLLSSVLSSIAVSSMVMKNRGSRGNARPNFSAVDHSLLRLGLMDESQVQSSLMLRAESMEPSPSMVVTPRDQLSTSTGGDVISSRAIARSYNQLMVSEWLEDYLSTREVARQPEEEKSKPQRCLESGIYSDEPKLNNRVFSAEIPDQDRTKEDDSARSDGFRDGNSDFVRPSPSPAILSTGDKRENSSANGGDGGSGRCGGSRGRGKGGSRGARGRGRGRARLRKEKSEAPPFLHNLNTEDLQEDSEPDAIERRPVAALWSPIDNCLSPVCPSVPQFQVRQQIEALDSVGTWSPSPVFDSGFSQAPGYSLAMETPRYPPDRCYLDKIEEDLPQQLGSSKRRRGGDFSSTSSDGDGIRDRNTSKQKNDVSSIDKNSRKSGRQPYIRGMYTDKKSRGDGGGNGREKEQENNKDEDKGEWKKGKKRRASPSQSPRALKKA